MYCKLFASLYQGTLRGRSHEILVFTNLLSNCDKGGYVDKHWRAIAEEVGLSVDEVKAACLKLESPDPESRSPELNGARIERMDDHRAWGWRVVNFLKYRNIRDADDRAEQNRIAQEKFRNKKSKPPSATVSHSKPPSAHADADAEAEAYNTHTGEAHIPTLEEVLAQADISAVTKESATNFFNHHQDNSLWINQFERLIDWKRKLVNWQTNDRQKGTQNATRRPTAPDRNAGTYNDKPLSDAAKSKVR